jgi:hypothetical protein
LAVFLVMVPTFISRWIVYGGPFETGCLTIRDFLWRSPVFFSVLFSSDHGLLSRTPLLALATLGLLLFMFRLPNRNPVFHSSGGFLSFYFLSSGLGRHFVLWQPIFHFIDTSLHSWLGLGAGTDRGALHETAGGPALCSVVLAGFVFGIWGSFISGERIC